MKKPLLNIAITMAFSSAVISGSIMSTQAYADGFAPDDIVVADNNTSNEAATESYMYPGMGVGAASGALVAGPAGMLIGGLIGAFAGASQEVSTAPEPDTSLAENTVEQSALISEHSQTVRTENSTPSETAEQTTDMTGIQLAQLGTINTVAKDPAESQRDTLLDILTADLSLDVYFRSGSTNIESFYPARLRAIADLMKTMEQLELHLDGYADRRGDKTKNIALANERIENVREQLIDAGVDEHRIISKAFGEMKMVSNAGDLEAYTFDRKVVIRFERISAGSISSMTTALSATGTDSTDDVVADTSFEF